MYRFFSFLLAGMLFLPASAKVSNDPPDVDIIAPYYIVVDANDPTLVYYERDPDEQCIPASTMKIMTCILTLENVKDLEETVVVTRQAATMKETNSLMHVVAGETLTVRQLLYGLMLHSGNDAALLLAEHVAGSVEAFSELANAKAAEIGMTSSHFLNASGAFRGGQYSTARDMALLMSYALKNDMFRTLISTPRFTIEANDVRKKPMELVNSNRLISDDPTSECYSSICIGGKTGSTDRGGDCLVSVGELDGARVICVLIGADDTNHRDANKRMPKVFKNAKYLLEYTLNNDYVPVSPSSLGFDYSTDVTPTGGIDSFPVSASFDETAVRRLPKAKAEELGKDTAKIEVATELSDDLASAKAGDTIGTITCSYDGSELFTGNLVADADAMPTPAPTIEPVAATPEPEAETAANHDAGLNPGVYIFGGISAILAVTLIAQIVLYFKKRR